MTTMIPNVSASIIAFPHASCRPMDTSLYTQICNLSLRFLSFVASLLASFVVASFVYPYDRFVASPLLCRCFAVASSVFVRWRHWFVTRRSVIASLGRYVVAYVTFLSSSRLPALFWHRSSGQRVIRACVGCSWLFSFSAGLQSGSKSRCPIKFLTSSLQEKIYSVKCSRDVVSSSS